MKKIKSDIIIIGAGLTGLSLAYHLRKRKMKVLIVEARDRLGGRIYTRQESGQAPVEMGATWVHGHHHATLDLLEELKLSVFKQEFGATAIYETGHGVPAQIVNMPPSGNPTFRIAGGSSLLIDRLSSNIDQENIYLGQNIISIYQEGDLIEARSDSHSYEGKMIISTLPPYLFSKNIDVTPALPQDLIKVASHTRTWMGESIKVALTYRERFWKNEHGSGTMFSKIGPMVELYDHSDVSDSTFAMKGFMNGAYHQHTKDERRELVLGQLENFYGAEVRDYLSYEDVAWSNEVYTAMEMKEFLEPQSNFGHLAFQKAYLNGRFIMAGTETSRREGGFMEGAVLSAKLSSDYILQNFTDV